MTEKTATLGYICRHCATWFGDQYQAAEHVRKYGHGLERFIWTSLRPAVAVAKPQESHAS